VNLPYIEDRFGLTIECLERQQAVLSHARKVIPNRPANIEGTPGFRANPTMPCEYRVAGAQGVKLMVAKSIMLNK
jgi:hypothetical protein